MPNVSAVVSTTRGTSLLPGMLFRRSLCRPTTSSSGKPSISLCIPGVLTDGGPRGRDEERFCRRRADGASLRCSSGAASERMAASAIEDIVAACVCVCLVCDARIWKATHETSHQISADASRQTCLSARAAVAEEPALAPGPNAFLGLRRAFCLKLASLSHDMPRSDHL